VLLGITEQLSDREPFHAPGFKYCGNLMPPHLPAKQLAGLLAKLQALATYLTQTFGLRGINGVDFIWYEELVWTIEVNPRISASLELMDRLYGIDSFTMHVESFSGQLPAFDLSAALATHHAAGKAIVYAPYNLTVGDTSDWPARGIKDVPHPGEQIEQGHPVCTLLAEGTSPADCLQKLRLQATRLIEAFQPLAAEHT
jgi:predicted ATP-grasp superfamily ATP-dependent carboligase